MKPRPISDERKRLRSSVVEVYKAYDRETRSNLLQYVKENLARLGMSGGRKLVIKGGSGHFDLPYRFDAPDDCPQNFRIEKLFIEKGELYVVGNDTTDGNEWTFCEDELATDDLLQIYTALESLIENIEDDTLTIVPCADADYRDTWFVVPTQPKELTGREIEKIRILVSHSGDPAIDVISVPRYIVETEYEDNVELFIAALYGNTPIDEWKAGPYKGIPVRTLEFTEDDDAESFIAEHHDDERKFI